MFVLMKMIKKNGKKRRLRQQRVNVNDGKIWNYQMKSNAIPFVNFCSVLFNAFKLST